jgi:hypothetical protein
MPTAEIKLAETGKTVHGTVRWYDIGDRHVECVITDGPRGLAHRASGQWIVEPSMVKTFQQFQKAGTREAIEICLENLIRRIGGDMMNKIMDKQAEINGG